MAPTRTAAAVGLLVALACTEVRAFPVAPYFPLVDGYTWTYRVDGVDGNRRTILPGTYAINGVPTKAARALPDGATSYFTSDASGVRQHATELSVHVGGVGIVKARLATSPPYVHTAADITIGAAVSTSGTATLELEGIGTFTGSYSATHTPVGFEAVTVPAGTFNALKIVSAGTASYNIFGDIVVFNSGAQTWLAENVGVVKEVSSDDGVVSTTELASLNFAPVLTFSSVSSHFGAQPANGLPGNVTMGPMVTNNGSFTVHLDSAVSGEFGLPSGSGCTVLEPGQYCFISPDFRPVSVGEKTGALTITSDAIGSPFVHVLSGSGIAVGLPSLAPGALDFGNQDRGITSASKPVSVTNSGSGALSLDSIATTGQYSAAHDCPASLPVGGSCTIQVTFTPFGAGEVTGSLIVDTSSGRLFVRLRGYGVGVAPPVSLSQGGTLTFGAVQVGTRSAAQSFTLNNNGTSHLNVISMGPGPGLPLGDFAFTTTCPAVLPGGASCAIDVTFAPTAEGQRYGYLYIHTDGYPSGDFLKPLSGIGSAVPVDTAPDAFAFPPKRGVPFNTRVASDPIIVTGIDAAAPLSIANGTYRINNGDPFVETPGTVNPGDSVVVYAYAAAKPATTRQATLTIGGVQGTFSVTTPGTIGADLAGNGRSAILWRNTSTGENYVYLMNGTGIVAEGYVRTVADQDWQVKGIGDFDGDGRSDILWRNATTGENYVYLMNETSIVGEGYLRTVADRDWQVRGIGDFDGDGRADILWRNARTGENYLYMMNGLSIASEGYLRTVADLEWRIAGVGDFDGDGRDDIVWRNAVTGENYLYLMNAADIAAEGYLRTVAELDWEIAGVGDFDGNAKADILWRNSATGENYLYLMNALSIADEGYLRTVADPGWRVAALGDFDGDGRSDIVWRHATTGENYLYPMEGRNIKFTEGYLRAVPDGAWTIVQR